MSKEHKHLRELYAGLLTEARSRRTILREVLNQHLKRVPAPLPDFAAFEFCYLQLRMLCEIVALCCLAAHGDLEKTRTRRLQSSTEPGLIIGALGKLNPEFYPIPYYQVLHPGSLSTAGEIREVK